MKNNKLLQNLLAKAFILFFTFIALQASAQTTAVSVFNYPGLNGSSGCDGENANLIGIISAIPTYTVDNSITSFSNATTLATQLDASEFFFMTDMETQNPSNTTFLPLASRDVIKNWVNAGGVMVMTGTFGTYDTDFLNLIFSWNLGTVSTSPWAKNTVNTAGTPFDGGPASLPYLSATDAISRGTVPDFTAMYGTDANATVAVIKYGAGSVIFMGYDFYDAGTSCGQYSSSWVQSIIPSSLNYARLLSSSVDNITYTSADVKYSFAQSGTTYYVLVPAGSTAPTDAQIEAGTNYSGVSVAASGSSATTANVDHVFSLTGLVYNTSYDFYTVTKYNLGSGDVYSDIEQVNFSTLDNDIPVGSSIPNQPLLCKNTAITPVSLTITDAYPGDNTFTVTGTSSNNSVVSDSNIVITGSGNSRSIAVTPNMNATGTSTISIRIQDSLLKESTVTFTVSFGDITKPTLTAVANRNENLDANCSFSIPDYTSLTTAADNCGTVTVTQSPLAGTIINNNGTVQMITLTANDGNGNFDSKTFNVTLVDAIAPIVIAKNIIVEISASGTATITASQLDNGTTDNCSTPILSIDKTMFTCEDLGANTVILRGTDAVGNFANQSAIVTIVDNIDPVFTSVPQISVNTDLDACGAIVTYTKPIANDNCAGQSNVLLIWDEINSNTTSLQNALIAAGNTVTLSATSETEYNGTNPALTGFNAVVHLNGTTFGTAMPIGGQNAILDFVLNQGKTYVTDEWSAFEADDAGTMTAMKEIIVLQRNSGFTEPTTYSQVSSQASHPILAGVPTSFNLPVAGGNIGFARVYSSNQPIVLMTSSQGDAVAVREFSNGGKAIGFQNAGNFNGSTVLSDVNIQKLYSNAVSYGAIVQLTQTAGLPSGSVFPVGTTTNTFTATDASGNMSTTSFDVVVTDNQLPIIASNGDINVNTDLDTCGATVVVSATATDNCTVGLPAGVRSDGLALDALYPVGTTTIAWNVLDANSNAAVEVIQTVVVTDNQVPVIVSNGDKNVNTDLDTCGTAVVVSATATDNCTVGLPAGVRSDGLALDALYPVGTTTIAWNVLDANSNAAVEVIQTVVVTDNQVPVIVSNGDKNVNTDLDTCGATVVVSATATDNCTVGLPTGVRSDGLALDALYPVGTTTISWNVTDANNNNSVAVTQTIVVTDIQKPVAITKNITVQLNATGNATITPADVNNGSTDACGIATLALDKTSFS
ncbi:HYR domain-containing protein, partial [Flavobacterium limicola]